MAHAHTIHENPGQIAGIAALSAAIGAITAMLFTPRAGTEMRQGIKRKAAQGKETMMDKIHGKKEDIAETAADMKEKAKDTVADMAEKEKKMADKTKDKADR